MKSEIETLLIIKGTITSLPPIQREACEELADFIRRACNRAEPAVGILAVALVGAEFQAHAAEEN